MTKQPPRIEAQRIADYIDKAIMEMPDVEARISEIAVEKYLELIAMQIAGTKFKATLGQSIAVTGQTPPVPGTIEGPWKK